MKRIISCSYKDDTPAFFSEEFFSNYKKGMVLVENMNGRRGISLRDENVACIVFWTKNASQHFMENMKTIRVPYYIQWTISGYGKDLEPNVPDKAEVIKKFKKAVKALGPRRVWWRYDPILISQKYTIEYHKQRFAQIAESLAGYTTHCVISFLDEYGKIKNEVRSGVMRAPTLAEIKDMAKSMALAAEHAGMTVQTCAEGQYDLTEFGIHEAPCIDAAFIEDEFGIELEPSIKRPESFRRCKCAVNTDIGFYHRCQHDCKYCYAK